MRIVSTCGKKMPVARAPRTREYPEENGQDAQERGMGREGEGARPIVECRNSRAESITGRRCSEIVPSSATYSGHRYVLFALLFPYLPTLPSGQARSREGCFVSSSPPRRPIIRRETPPSTSSISRFFLLALVSPSPLGFNETSPSVAVARAREERKNIGT